MKVQELRTLIKKYDRGALENIIVELYKTIPKAKKEYDGIDVYLNNVSTGKKIEKTTTFNFEDLASEIELFLSQAKEGLYYKPNNIVSKEQRTKWRFKVKNYYKVLSNIPSDAPDGGISTKLLVEIYKCLSRGTYYSTFSNYETFRSIGVMQSAYFNMLADRVLYKNCTEGAMRILVSLIAVNRDGSWYEEENLNRCFIERLRKESLCDKVLEPIEEAVVNEFIPIRTERAKVASVYYYDDIIDNLAECYARASFEVDKIQEGIDFFLKYYNQRYTHSRIYDLLELLFEYKRYEEWMRLYNENEVHVKDMRIQEYYEFVKKRLKEL